MKKFRMIWGAWLAVFTTVFLVASASAQSESDSTIRGYEASEVHLTLGSDSSILGVRVEGCELCKQQSYLPARDIVVSRGARDISAAHYQRVSGNPGTIMFDGKNKMVFEVNFWVPRGEGDVR